MAVEIKFIGDFTDVKAQLDRLIADARSNPIPIAGTFAAGVASLGGGGSTPTIAGTLGVANVSNGIAPYAAGSFQQAAGGFGAQGANPGFFNAQFGASGGGVAAGIFGFPGSPSSAAGGAGPSGAGGAVGASGFAVPASWPSGMQQAGWGGGGSGTPGVMILNQSGAVAGGWGGGGGAGGSGAGGNAGGAAGGAGGWGGGGGLANRLTMRLLGGLAIQGAGQLIEADRQYTIASALAGSDQRGQLDAQLEYRKRVIASTSIAGVLAEAINDPGATGEISVRNTLREADIQENRTALTKASAKDSQKLRDAAASSGIENDFERASIVDKQKHEQAIRDIDERKKTLAAVDDQKISAHKLDLDKDRESRVANRVVKSENDPDYFLDNARSRLINADAKTIADETHEAAMKRDQAFAGDYAAENKRYDRQTATRNLQQGREQFLEGTFNAGMAGVFRAIAGGRDSDNVERLKILAEVHQANLKEFQKEGGTTKELFDSTVELGNQRIAAHDKGVRDRIIEEGNQFNDSVSVARYETTAAKARLAARPLDAALASNEANRSKALSSIDPLTEGDLYDPVNDLFNTQKHQIIKDYRFERAQRLTAAEDRGRVLDVELKGGVFSDIAGRALEIKQNAFERMADQQYHGESQKTIIQDLKNAQLSEQLLSKNFLQRFQPTEIDLQKTSGASLAGGGGEVLEVLKQIADAAREIAAKKNDTGRAGP